MRKALILGVLMATLMSVLLGCQTVDDNAVNQISTQLSKKYGMSFTVAAIGDRIGKDTTTAYVYADRDPSMRFAVRIKDNGQFELECFAYRTVCRNLEKMANQSFEKRGMNTQCFAVFSPMDNDVAVDTQIKDYLENNHPDLFSIAMIVRDSDNATGERIMAAYSDVSAELSNVDLVLTLYTLADEDYEKLAPIIEKETRLFDENDLRAQGTAGAVHKVIIRARDTSAQVVENGLAEEVP